MGQPKWKFSTGKKTFHAGKKIRKNDFAPQKNFAVTPLAFLDTDENIQKLLQKTITIFDPFSIINFECLIQF